MFNKLIASRAIKQDVTVIGGSGGATKDSVPVYRDGSKKDWALNRQGAQLMLPNGTRAWYYIPETLSSAVMKYYVKLDAQGRVSFVQIFDLRGDAPVLIGLPTQQLWVEYSHLQRVVVAPPPVVSVDGEYEVTIPALNGVATRVTLKKV